MSDLKEVRHFDVQVSFAKTTAAFNASAGTTARQSPVRQLPGNFAEENEKLATGWSAESSAPQTLRRLILLGFHGSRGINSATLACRAPLLTQVLNVMTASSLTVAVQSVGRRAYQLFQQVSADSAPTRQKKSPVGMKEVK